MKISVFYDHVRIAALEENRTIPEILAEIKKYGITAVDVDFSALNRELTDTLSAAGFTLGSLYGFFTLREKTALEPVEAMIDAAVRLHTDAMVVPGSLTKEAAAGLKACKTAPEIFDFMDNCPETVTMCRNLAYLCGYGAARGIQVGVEDFDSNTSPTQRIGELKWFLQNTPGLCWNLDTGNFTSCDEDLEEAVRVLGSYIYHIHCKDKAPDGVTNRPFCKGSLPAATGHGYLPMEKVLKQVIAEGFHGTCSIEHFGAVNQLEYMKLSGEFLSSL